MAWRRPGDKSLSESMMVSLPTHICVTRPQWVKAMRSVENEDVVGAAPTGDAPTTSEWSAILLPSKVRLILENWRYIPFMQVYRRITGFSSGHPELPLLTVRMLQFLRHTKLTGKRSKHDDVIKWKNIPRYWSVVWGIHGSSAKSPHKGQWRGNTRLSK